MRSCSVKTSVTVSSRMPWVRLPAAANDIFGELLSKQPSMPSQAAVPLWTMSSRKSAPLVPVTLCKMSSATSASTGSGSSGSGPNRQPSHRNRQPSHRCYKACFPSPVAFFGVQQSLRTWRTHSTVKTMARSSTNSSTSSSANKTSKSETTTSMPRFTGLRRVGGRHW